ncbi:MAG: methyltransferase family protein [Anaerolineales bacterium]
MTTTSHTSPSSNRQTLTGMLARAAQIGSVLVIQAAILLIASGHFDWAWAWVFLGIYLVSIAVNSAFMLHNNPDTVAERGRASLTRDWDKTIAGWWSLMQFLLVPLVAALDLRFAWTLNIGIAWHAVGAVLFAAGLGLFGWAMITNSYFSTAVRIQSERGQTVCRTGPYAFVRHPGYTGTLLQSIGMPLLLGSWWALIPGLLAAGLMTARTMLEDRALQAELPGYADFVQDVHYRLIPGIW